MTFIYISGSVFLSLSPSPESTRYHLISSALQVRRETLLFAKDGLYNLYMGLQLDRDFVWLLKMSINDDDDLSEWSSHTLNIRSFTFVINFHNFTVKQTRTGVRQAGRQGVSARVSPQNMSMQTIALWVMMMAQQSPIKFELNAIIPEAINFFGSREQPIFRRRLGHLLSIVLYRTAEEE